MLRWCSLLPAALLLAAVALTAPPPPLPSRGQLPALAAPLVDNPDHQVRLAARHLAAFVKEEDAPYCRFITFQGVPKEITPRLRRVLCWWLHQMSFEKAIALPGVVDGSLGMLWAIDVRDYRWNAGAWQAVARRDRRYVEPACPNKETEYLRRTIGVRQDPKTLHAEAIIPATFLFRDTIEGDRSPSYYDLLYAQFRFIPDTVKETRPVELAEEVKEPVKVIKKQWFDACIYQGKRYEAGYWDVETIEYRTKKVARSAEKELAVPGFRFVDFPKNKADFEKAFGVDVTRAFLKKSKILAAHGSIAGGLTEDPKLGSFVARSNRMLLFEGAPFGINYESFDVVKATGKKDYLEQAPSIAQGKIEFDAQELLYSLPNGGQACLLTVFDGGKNTRVELAAGQVAIGPDKTFPQVRNPGDCVVCHAPGYGLVSPQNLVKDTLESGVDVKIKDRQKLLDFTGFYLGWEKRLKGYTIPYDALVEATTREDYKDPRSKPLTGAQLAKEFAFLRSWYDAPVSLELAALELGVPVAVCKGLLVQLPLVRAQRLALNQPCPRPTWDEDVMPALIKLLAADRKGGDVRGVP